MLTTEMIERVLVVTAHPDDVDFAAAGTIAGWTDAGVAVSYCICTDGDAGGFDPAVPREEIAAIRQTEQRAAAKEVGVSDVAFLGHKDGRLQPTLALRRDISREIRRVRPQLVVTQSPTRNWERIFASHPDHLAAGEAAMCAVYPDARNPFAHPELGKAGLEAWTVSEVWVSGGLGPGLEPDVFVDVTAQWSRKIAALMAHESQHPGMPGEGKDLDGFMRPWMASQAKTGGLPDGTLAEAFRRVITA